MAYGYAINLRYRSFLNWFIIAGNCGGAGERLEPDQGLELTFNIPWEVYFTMNGVIKMSSQRIVVVGGVAGGATAAAKARRNSESAEITLFERGHHISFANCGLPYFIGGEIQDHESLLLTTPEAFSARYRIQVNVQHEVIGILRHIQQIEVRTAEGTIMQVPYDKLILAQGAEPIVPVLPGVDSPHVFTLRNLTDMDQIVSFLETQNPKRALVVGGGYIGLEMAEAFFQRGMEVHVVEMAPHILPRLEKDLAKELESRISDPRFVLHCGLSVSDILKDEVMLNDGSFLPADLVLLSAGVRPENRLARDAGLEVGVTGGIKTNGRMQTSDPRIFAVGDMAEVRNFLTGAPIRLPLAGPANRQGRIAGANATGAHMTYAGALGTSIVRVREQVIAMVGLNGHEAIAAGLNVKVSVSRDPHHASYFPGAKPLVTLIIAEEGSGRLLGAQILGQEGVDKRIDVLATAMYGGMSVFDLEVLDLSYAPPFGSANDPLNVAGFISARELRGETPTVDPRSVKPDGDYLLLDVRNPEELRREGTLKGAINIPLGTLRENLKQLKNQPILVFCQKGQRGYLASRILMDSGFEDVWNLKGGFLQAKWNGWEIEMAEVTSPMNR